MGTDVIDSIMQVQRMRPRNHLDTRDKPKTPLAKRFWNRYAKSYSSVETLFPHRKMIQDTISLIPASAESVLDLGCGTGVLLQRVCDENPSRSLYGIDFSEAMLEVTASRVPGAHLSQADFNQRLPFKDSMFDCVVCSNALYTVNSPKRLVAELLRITRPNGLIVISSPKRKASGIAILWDHWRNAGFINGIVDLVRFAPCIFYNLVIEHQARERRYHFLSEDEVTSLADSVVIHPDTFANQNWLFTIQKTS